MSETRQTAPANFIEEIITGDLATNKYGGRVHTRFPPEPNGYLHIGHAKAALLNYGLAEKYGGLFNLRFDDTNPSKEEVEYVESIKRDLQWLGCNWEDRLFYASGYFERLYEYAERLIEKGLAYVCDLSPEEIREYRGTLTEPGRESPYRNRSVAENLDLFRRMRAGEFPDGSRVLRAKIDMASPNLNMRDPVIYRIMHVPHHRTGDKWCIYPMYDFAHPLSDAIEGITHSICSLEFEDHRPLYNWFLEALEIKQPPQQIEFARLNLNYTVMSKRKLRQLVEEGYVKGWDDPRMPTLSGLRRRGYTPEAIRSFCQRIGVAKSNSVVDIALLEHCLREDLNKRAPRVMGVLRPLRLVIENYPEGKAEEVEAVNNPEDPAMGTRKLPFSRVLYIDRDDFREVPPKKYYRLAPGQEVRLKYAYLVTCTDVIKDERTGEVVELRCVYDPASRGGSAPDGRKVKGTIHWVSAAHAQSAEVRLYDRLFTRENPDDDEDGRDFKAFINPDSLEVLTSCLVEPGLAGARPGEFFQFERVGYFCVDPDSVPGKPVFNRSVSLRDSWAKIEEKYAVRGETEEG
ncbi:MAG: glutamine--tRNA ligase/YqeY domain fusion protein [Clostridia bacterium]|nr:glutamine--tRNA ligase/YqeY domain fusion protein [Clostridia bacterium]